MRHVAGILLTVCALAQVPREDARLRNTPGTDTHYTMPVYRTLAEWETRKTYLRKQILSAAGLLPMPEKTPLHPQIFRRIENKDYSIETVLLETMPGYYLGGNLYRPAGRKGKFPAIASPHGHWIYGRLENSVTGSIPARCINLARQGFVVFAYDMVGYNDTIQTPHAFGGPREQLWSFGPLGLQLWNSIRVVDFLQSLPDVDPARIGATGASGGGTQTFLLTAVDDRVVFSAPVNMISAIMQGGSPCENAPGLRIGTFNVEIGAMMAPRPMLMVAATGDWTRNTPREEFPAVQSIYRLYGKQDELEMVQIDAPHNYNQQSREAVYAFFGKRINGRKDASKLKERGYRPEPLQNMLALHNRTLPANALTYEQIVDQWIANARKQFPTDATAARERLALALAAQWPAKVLSERNGERVALSREGSGERVTGIWREGRGTPIVVLDPGGVEAARKLAPAGRPVLLLDPFPGKRDETARHFFCFNKTDAANQVQDILTALAWIGKPGIELVGSGRAAAACLFAAAVAPTRVALKADISGFAGNDRDFIERFFVPGIQRAGGLQAARLLIK
ncbi:MAG: hypothetical protein M1436_03670 [Acidobacteria bacterium]|nr:hypothetical protein [Acidobacteriota bacterium]